jgi:hypothetical protein
MVQHMCSSSFKLWKLLLEKLLKTSKLSCLQHSETNRNVFCLLKRIGMLRATSSLRCLCSTENVTYFFCNKETKILSIKLNERSTFRDVFFVLSTVLFPKSRRVKQFASSAQFI